MTQPAPQPAPTLADVLDAVAALHEDVVAIKAVLIKPSPDEPDWLTTPEAAQRAGVSLQCIRNWAKPRECGGFEIGKLHGRQWRVNPSLLDALLADRGRG